MKTQDAFKLAQEKGLDLIVIAENTKPPVAKILDFNKYLYEERKKASAAKTKSKKSELKELRLSSTIGEWEFNIRVRRAKEFLSRGNRVKISLKLQGRKMEHPEIGFEKVKKFISDVSEVAKTESEPRLMGNVIIVTLVSK